MITVVNAEFAKSKQHQPKISRFFTGGNAPADNEGDAEDNGAAGSLMCAQASDRFSAKQAGTSQRNPFRRIPTAKRAAL
ncbi:MAG: hypothetical protein QM760_08075 [Nibricoccus sp.]